jgi:hypothetical protein
MCVVNVNKPPAVQKQGHMHCCSSKEGDWVMSLKLPEVDKR